MSEDHKNETQRASWDSRALEKGTSLEGVLYRGLPDNLNQYLHDFHAEVVLHKLLPRIPTGGRVLDLGCGFGRISLPIRDARGDIKLVGADFSKSYCGMYAKQINKPVVCADIQSLPFRPGLFDGIVAVTSLMYIAEKKRDSVITAVNGLLKPGGHGLYIDPGHEFKRLAATLKPSTAATPTGGSSFRARDYKTLGRLRTEIADFGGVPGFSSLLPALYLTSGKPALFKTTREIARFLDRKFPRWWRFSIHRWILVRRPAANQAFTPAETL